MSKSELKAQATIAASELVSAQAITAAIKASEKRLATIRESHATPDGQDIKNAVRIMTSRSSVAIMLAAFNWTASELVANVFDFKATFKPQRAVADYMPLKAIVKLEALAIALVTGNPKAYWNSTKYLASQIVLFEATNTSELANSDVYAIYTSNQTRINALIDQIDDSDYRAMLKNAELYKAESTASTQRVTSAWLLQVMRAGENNGNDRTIVADRSSDNYKVLRDLFIGASVV